ncbi:NAT_SF domain containing protein [uncultured Caudovirales phage]|uniref:NAT_SF domain containing protein n=1 Tax=uncultured Caudovirales phage TaxID=2100421 RepID=A0A6J5LEK4_9CAUD|nr:NAT_SF domain containing protein [uncultured Caudovirales phage]
MIRQANKFDMEAIVRMLKAYRDKAPAQYLRDSNNQEHIEKLISNILAGAGFILLAIKDDDPVGMVIAAQHPNIWNPEVTQISEIAFWLDEEHRGGKFAHRLLHAYIQQCEEWKQENRIHFFSLSKMVNSPDLSYEKFGFEKLEETWIK